jgi:hypothetical protein
VLAAYGSIDAIPERAAQWTVPVRGAEALAESLRTHRIEAALYRTLARLREDVPLAESLDDLRWRGARRSLVDVCREIDDMDFVSRIESWRD